MVHVEKDEQRVGVGDEVVTVIYMIELKCSSRRQDVQHILVLMLFYKVDVKQILGWITEKFEKNPENWICCVCLLRKFYLTSNFG